MMDWDFNIEGLTKTIADFYAQQRAKKTEIPQRRTVTLQFPDGLMAYACDISRKVHDALSVRFLFFLKPFSPLQFHQSYSVECIYRNFLTV